MSIQHTIHGATVVALALATTACHREPPTVTQTEGTALATAAMATPVAASASPASPSAASSGSIDGPLARQPCLEHFAAFDDDGDRLVSLVEFSFRPHAEVDPAGVFRGRDTNHDGSLTEAEFCSGWRGSQGMMKAGGPGTMRGPGANFGRGFANGRRRMAGPMTGMRCEQHFDAFDVDHDGTLTPDEFAAWPHVRGDAQALFEERDANDDRAVTNTEFCSP